MTEYRIDFTITRRPTAADVTTIKQWIRCICGHARGRAAEPREDCPECGWAPGTHRPPVKVAHLGVAPAPEVHS